MPQQKKYILQTSSTADGVPVIDVLPLMDDVQHGDEIESSDNDCDDNVTVGTMPSAEEQHPDASSNNSAVPQDVAASPSSLNGSAAAQQQQQLTAQVDVEEMTPHYITVTGMYFVVAVDRCA